MLPTAAKLFRCLQCVNVLQARCCVQFQYRSHCLADDEKKRIRDLGHFVASSSADPWARHQVHPREAQRIHAIADCESRPRLLAEPLRHACVSPSPRAGNPWGSWPVRWFPVSGGIEEALATENDGIQTDAPSSRSTRLRISSGCGTHETFRSGFASGGSDQDSEAASLRRSTNLRTLFRNGHHVFWKRPDNILRERGMRQPKPSWIALMHGLQSPHGR